MSTRHLVSRLLLVLSAVSTTVAAAWTDITPQITPHLGWPYADSAHQVWGTNFSLTNSTTGTLIGPLRVVITDSNIPLASGWGAPHGTASDGKPYYTIASAPAFSLAPGADSPLVRLNFEMQRKRLSYQVRVEQDQVPPPAPELSVDPSNLAYGPLPVGSTARQGFAVSNTGTDTLNVTGVDLVGAGFALVGPSSFSVPVGAPAQAIAVDFTPTEVAAYSGTVTVHSDAGSANVALSGSGEAAPAPQIALTPASLAFDALPVGQSASLSFSVANTGDAALVVSTIDVDGAGFAVDGPISFSVLVGAAAQEVAVSFSPSAAGPYGATVTVQSNAGPAEVSVSGSGKAAAPEIEVTPVTLGFGNVTVGSSVRRSFAVANVGDAELTVSAIDLVGEGFALVGPTGFSVAAGGPPQSVDVDFSPTAADAYGGLVSVLSNGGTAEVVLDGNGVPVPSGKTKVYYFHNDQLGTPQLLTDQNGTQIWHAHYRPFGQAMIEENPDGDGQQVNCNLRFPGQYFDHESGLHYNYLRYYDPEAGRYLTFDPIGLEGGLNAYAYAAANPVIRVDPDGTFTLFATSLRRDMPLTTTMEAAAISDAAVSAGAGSVAYGASLLMPGPEDLVSAAVIGGILKVGRFCGLATNKLYILEEAGGAIHLRATTSNGTVEIISDIAVEGEVLVLRSLHIGGLSPGELGRAGMNELKSLAADLARSRGLKAVVIEGGRRSSGRMEGRVPTPIRIQVE